MQVALFGFVAQGEANPTSDIDIMIEVEHGAAGGMFEYVGIKQYIADPEGSVDVVDRDGLKPYICPAVTTDAIYAF